MHINPIKPIVVLLLLAISNLTTPYAKAQQPATGVNQDRDRGVQLYHQGHINEAVEALRKAVREHKDDYEAWYFLGLALVQKKDLKAAIRSFETTIKLKPDLANAHLGLAYALLLRNENPAAIREGEAALNLDPGIPDAHYIIGVARLRTGVKQEALEQAETVIRLRPQFAPAYLLKSQALVSFLGDAIVGKHDESAESRRARYDEAATALEKYLELTPAGESRQTWTEQLEGLRFYLSMYEKGHAEVAFAGAEVTTKARVVSKPEPTYTEAARQNQIVGTVILRAVFSADGTVRHVLVVSGLSYGLTENAINAARKIKFIPATINGRPVSMFMELQYNFNLY